MLAPDNQDASARWIHAVNVAGYATAVREVVCKSEHVSTDGVGDPQRVSRSPCPPDAVLLCSSFRQMKRAGRVASAALMERLAKQKASNKTDEDNAAGAGTGDPDPDADGHSTAAAAAAGDGSVGTDTSRGDVTEVAKENTRLKSELARLGEMLKVEQREAQATLRAQKEEGSKLRARLNKAQQIAHNALREREAAEAKVTQLRKALTEDAGALQACLLCCGGLALVSRLYFSPAVLCCPRDCPAVLLLGSLCSIGKALRHRSSASCRRSNEQGAGESARSGGVSASRNAKQVGVYQARVSCNSGDLGRFFCFCCCCCVLGDAPQCRQSRSSAAAATTRSTAAAG